MKTISLLLILAVSGILGVDKNNFKTCEQSGFCKRLRSFKPEKSQYSLNLDTVIIHGNVLAAEVVTEDTESEKKTVLVSPFSCYFQLFYLMYFFNTLYLMNTNIHTFTHKINLYDS